MKKTVIQSLVLLINVLFINESLGQSRLKHTTYTQNDFEKNKVFEETYQLQRYKDKWSPNVKDTLPYFVDDRNYKGIINYGVIFRLRDHRDFNFFESESRWFLKVEIGKCGYNPKDSVINIEGFVSNSCNVPFREKLTGNELIGNAPVRNGKIQNHIDIFLGEKTDTINDCYLGRIVNPEAVEIKLNGKEIDEFAVLDTFPAFYFKKYSHCKTALEGRRPFKISGKITKNTLLAFGTSGCYSEIFDLGAMIYYPNKNKRKKNIQKEQIDCKPLIIKNSLVADIEKEKLKVKEINYYTYTQNAESCIITRQYAKAKEQYNLLNQNYPLLFSRDIHNAIRCAILSRDFKTAFLWGEKLAAKGVELPYFDAKIFTGLRKNQGWKSFSIKYDSICKLAKSNWNLKLKNELIDLLNEDQADYGLENRKDPEVLHETTERVTGKLIDLLKKEGYPSEERIGSYVKNDTVLVSFPDYNVLIRHAMQQKPKNLALLKDLLDKSIDGLEYDSKRSPNNVTPYNSCYQIYKGDLYISKSCGNIDDLTVKKIVFGFKNPKGFIVDCGNYTVSEYNKENPKEWNDYYEQNFNFIMKLTDDWEFYDK